MSIDFTLTPELEAIRLRVREFIDDVVKPGEAKIGGIDTVESRVEYIQILFAMRGEAQKAGLWLPHMPEEWGGMGLGHVELAMVQAEAAKSTFGPFVLNCQAPDEGNMHTLLHWATDEQKERYLRPLASGAKLGAYGLTEAGAGSDSRGTRTRAHRDGDQWVLAGSKRFITNAGVADTYIVTAVTDRNTDSGKISAFIVEADTPGFSIGRMEEKMGLHASNTGELLFDDCRIPAENLLGDEGDGDRLFLKTLDGGRIGIGAMALGLAQAAYEAASAYAKERQQFGRPIASFQGIAFKIADMATQIDAARLMVYRAAWLKDGDQPYSTEAAMAKLFASEVARQVTNDALQVHGGYGYVTEYKVERYLRDAKLTEIGEGTSEIQRMVIARNLLGVRAM
jgi:butyryl-CoA dehydrogenase